MISLHHIYWAQVPITLTGAILNQGTIGSVKKSVAHASKALKNAELAYNVIQKEFCTVV
jgi:hypothetical protein